MASAASSPAIPQEHPVETQSQQQYPQLSAMPPAPSMGPPTLKPQNGGSYAPDSKGRGSRTYAIAEPGVLTTDLVPPSGSGARGYEYNQEMSGWISSEPNSPHHARTANDLGGWKQYPHGSPVAPGYQYAPQPSQGSNWPPQANGLPSGNDSNRSEDGWSPYGPQGRSLSFGGEQGGHYTVMSHNSQSVRSSFDRRSSMGSDIYPSTISTTMASIETPPHGPISAGSVPPPGYAWQQYPYSKGGDGYGGWYIDAQFNDMKGAHPNAPQGQDGHYYGGNKRNPVNHQAGDREGQYYGAR